MKSLRVLKKDGTIENWSDDKIVVSIAKAGVSLKDAEDYAANVKSWAEKYAEKNIIKSYQLKNKVIDEIRNAYPAEAENYKTYKQ